MPSIKEAELPILRPMVSRMRGGETLNCAVGEIDTQSADIALHPMKQPQALVKELKKTYPKMRKAAHGVAFIPQGLEKEMHLRLGTTPASKIGSRLLHRLKGTGIKKIVIFTGDELAPDWVPWESEGSVEQDDDVPISPAEALQAQRSAALKERVRDLGARVGTMAVGAPRKQAGALLVQAVEALHHGDEARAATVVDALAVLVPAGEPAQAPAQGAIGDQPARPRTPVVVPEAMRDTLQQMRGDLVAAREAAVEGPEKDAFMAIYARMGRETQSGQFDAAKSTAKEVRGAAFTVVATQARLEQQRRDWEAMQPVLKRVEKSYFAPSVAKSMLKGDLKPGKEFKAFLAAYVGNTKAHTVEGCDRVVKTAQAYLDHCVADVAREERLSPDDQVRLSKKKLMAGEAIVAARHMRMALQMREMGPPPWQEADALRATGIRTSFDIETTHDDSAWAREAVPGEDEQGKAPDPWPELRNPGHKPAGVLKLDDVNNVNATFWIDGYDPDPASAAREKHHFVFKPRQGEHDMSETDGFPARGGAAREVVSQKLAESLRGMTGIDFNVPETSIAEIDPRALDLQTFNDSLKGKGSAESRTIPTDRPVIGSAQRFKPSRGALGKFPEVLAQVPPDECQKAAILDIITLNSDRHKDNFLVGEKPSAAGETVPTLLPIDHGVTLPDRNGLRRVGRNMSHPRQNILLSMPGSYEVFTPDMRDRIERINPTAVRQVVLDARATVDVASPGAGAGVKIADECADLAARAARFLKLAGQTLPPALVQIALATTPDLLDGDEAAFEANARAAIDRFAGKGEDLRDLLTGPDFENAEYPIRKRTREIMGHSDLDWDELRSAMFDRPREAMAAFAQAREEAAHKKAA